MPEQYHFAQNLSFRQKLNRKLFSSFIKRKEGATAIEFGLVAMPFFALLTAILETGLVFWTTQVLENAVANATRQVYTGQFQQANSGQSSAVLAQRFRDLICQDVKGLFDCEGRLKVDIRSFTSFPASAVPLPVNNNTFDTSDFAYRATAPNEIVVARAAMEYPVYFPSMSFNQAKLSSGNRLVMASATFRNEPFQ